jgi:Protein of unknown function (DUF1579)
MSANPRLIVLPALVALALMPASGSRVRGGKLSAAGTTVPTAGNDAACLRPELKQFAFWIGDWDLTSSRRASLDKDEWIEDSGRASDHVTSTLGGCALLQEWDGTPAGIPLTGMSLSSFDPALRKWRQVWVDTDGAYMEFRGGMKEGRMELYREGVQNGKKTIWRQVFLDIQPDRFRWRYERSFDGGRSWITTWKLAYTRRT